MTDLTGDERSVLLSFLDMYRDVMVYKIEGLSEQQARMSPTPGGNSLLNLIVHLTGVERSWFQNGILGETIERDRLSEFRETTMNVDDAVAAYRAACQRSNEIAKSVPSLDDLGAGEGTADRSVRWVLIHLIEETARHAGHADITRELIDGSVGYSRYEPD